MLPSVFAKGSGLQLGPAGRSADTFSAWADEFREMADIIVGIGIDELAGLGIGMKGRKAKVTNVIGAACFIEQDIPIGPGHGAIVEIIDHGVTIAFAQRPVVDAVEVELLLATFREDEVLAGECLVYEAEVIKLHGTARPGFVPMESDAPHVFSGVFIVEDDAGTLIQQDRGYGPRR